MTTETHWANDWAKSILSAREGYTERRDRTLIDRGREVVVTTERSIADPSLYTASYWMHGHTYGYRESDGTSFFVAANRDDAAVLAVAAITKTIDGYVAAAQRSAMIHEAMTGPHNR